MGGSAMKPSSMEVVVLLGMLVVFGVVMLILYEMA
jgi:hypothetical protein